MGLIILNVTRTMLLKLGFLWIICFTELNTFPSLSVATKAHPIETASCERHSLIKVVEWESNRHTYKQNLRGP